MLRSLAIAFGVVFIAIGLLGFLPAAAPDGLLFGLFEIGFLHNLVHLITGGVALGLSVSGEASARLYFRISGPIYAVLAALGLYYGDRPLMGVLAHNWADVVLHLAFALIAIYLGFLYRPSKRPAREADAI